MTAHPLPARPGRARRARSLVARALLGGVVLGGAVLAPFGPGALPARGAQCAEPGEAISQVPWPQQRQPPQAIWPVADGAGTTVAVLASGVDAGHPQLAGRVRAGEDYLPGADAAPDADCEGLGTQVAGIVAASYREGVGFTGLAPRATIVPYRVATGPTVGSGGDPNSDPSGGDRSAGSPESLAEALRDAAADRPDVIVVPVVTYTDDPTLRAAVAEAIADDVVVVAATGDRPPTDGPGVPYPAAYDGVVGVGAIGPDGARGGDAGARASTDLVGPGDGLVSTQVGGGLVPVGGSAIAAGYVAGTVALVRGRWPGLKGPDVVRRLLATATPLGDGALVSPAQAVTETVTTGSPEPLIGADDRAPVAPVDEDDTVALVTAAALGGVAVLVVALVIALPRGRKRRWRPGLAPRPEEHPEDDEPTPPRLLFEDWTPGGR